MEKFKKDHLLGDIIPPKLPKPPKGVLLQAAKPPKPKPKRNK